MSISGKLLTR